MKLVLPLFMLICLGACQKNTPAPVLAAPATDTVLFQFTYNGVQFEDNDTFSTAPTSYTLKPTAYIWGIQTPLFEGTQPLYNFYLNAFANQRKFENIAIMLYGDTVYATPTVGTYTYVSPQLDTVGNFSNTRGYIDFTYWTWGEILSDTVTISSISNGYADGTFSATFSDPDSALVLHVSDGVFRNLPIY
jgi:hypothetical protein